MCASQQWRVFDSEHTEEWMVFGGENTDDLEPMQGRLFNPAPNFINCRFVFCFFLHPCLVCLLCLSLSASWSIKIKSLSSGPPPGATWTWLKCWYFVTSSGLCCLCSLSPEPPGYLCSDWATCLPAFIFCSSEPSCWSNPPEPAWPCGTASSCIMWRLL